MLSIFISRLQLVMSPQKLGRLLDGPSVQHIQAHQSEILVAARSAKSWSSKPPIGASGDISGLSRPPWPAAVLN